MCRDNMWSSEREKDYVNFNFIQEWKVRRTVQIKYINKNRYTVK